MELSCKKKRALKSKIIGRIEELKKLPNDTNPREFLTKRFKSVPSIWRIFLLHCWSGQKYPIFDQHVYRAMKYIKDEEVFEGSLPESRRTKAYLDEYIEFYDSFRMRNNRNVDKALWAFGKFLSTVNPAFLKAKNV
jgi:hypothetical protein